MFEAKIIADSICDKNRLTTIQVTSWKVLDAEVQKHCAFAINASSARAIPLNIAIKKVENDPFIPIYWGAAQHGMSASKEIENKEAAIMLWHDARNYIVEIVKKMGALGLHKQIPSRLLSPFEYITAVITGDQEGWSNFFAQRCHPDAQPEMQHAAFLAQKVYFESTPIVRKIGDWHLPYVQQEERSMYEEMELVKISTGRTARTSYLTQEGIRDKDKDLDLHNKLIGSKPKHLSPAAHVAQANPGIKSGKFNGWVSYRKQIPNEFITDFEPNYKEYFGEK